jgi:hypothetical protein
MDEPLDEGYFKWLYGQVSPLRLKNPTRTYWALLRQLYQTEFVWFVPNDDNRLEDGRDLRYEFMDSVHGLDRSEVDPEWLGLGCSMLEMLIALSRHLSFEAEGEVRDWFWHLLDQLDLRKYNDRFYDPEAAPHKFQAIEETLERVIWRRYNYDGTGGLFPLRNPTQDQRDVELWYQMGSYIVELL